MGGVREDVEAPGIVDELVAGEEYIALFRDEADEQEDHGGGPQSKGGEQDEPVAERVSHPDGGDRLVRRSKGGPRPQADGIEEHSVKIPADQSKWDIGGKFSLVPVDPGPELFRQPVLQLCQVFGWAEHRQHLLSL